MPKKNKTLCVDDLRHAEYYGMQPVFDELYHRSLEGENFTDLMDLILSRDNILLAYRNIKANGGSYTAGTDNKNISVPFPVSWTVKMKKKQKETQDILSYHSQAAGCSDKARAKASGGRQPIEECGRTGL